MISRYEEYLPCVKDAHGRYASFQSVNCTYGFIMKAMVNRYVFWIVKWLRMKFPDIDIELPKPKVLFSFDIDHPFYSKDISLDRMIYRHIKNLSFFDTKDKYDCFDFVLDNIKKTPAIFFFLCQKEPSEQDNYNNRESTNFKNLILRVREQSKIGIHPSYFAAERNLLQDEIHWLSHLHQRPIKSSRFHYLKNNMETAYTELIKQGIQFDFSMAYGTTSGFRSGTSLPFYYYDLKKNRKTDLLIFTPCIMDSCFEYHHEVDFYEKYSALLNEVKTYGGTFLPIFHNNILATKSWQEEFLNAIKLLNYEI
jgi:hypothetical protein